MHLVTPGPTLQPPATVNSCLQLWNSVCARHLITCADVIKILLSSDPKTTDTVSGFQSVPDVSALLVAHLPDKVA